jgi:hypothetical protein
MATDISTDNLAQIVRKCDKEVVGLAKEIEENVRVIRL